MASDIHKFHFRLVLLGSNKTGKTAILNRFLFKKFEDKYKPTVEDLFSKQFDLGSVELKVDFLDTSGSMQFPAMRRLSITTGDAFLIVYALDDENSYEVLKLCMAEIQEIRPDFQEIPIVFVGNKVDLPREQRKVPKEMVSNYVYYELPRLRTKVIECSCRDNQNIENIFKSYLSLARVSLGTNVIVQNTVSATSHHSSLTNKKRPASTIPGENYGHTSTTTNSSCSTPKHAIYAAQTHQNNNNTKPNATSTTTTTSMTNAHSRSTSTSKGSTSSNSSGDSPGGSSCATSIKVALGVRKSCDASIVSSMRKVSLSGGGGGGGNWRNSREQLLESMCEFEQKQQEQGRHKSVVEVQQPMRQQVLNNNNNQDNCVDNLHEQTQPIKRLNQKSSIESLLKEAKQQQHHQQLGGKLSVGSNGGAKPRSRSLIWRPHRKSSRAAQSDSSECRVT